MSGSGGAFNIGASLLKVAKPEKSKMPSRIDEWVSIIEHELVVLKGEVTSNGNHVHMNLHTNQQLRNRCLKLNPVAFQHPLYTHGSA